MDRKIVRRADVPDDFLNNDIHPIVKQIYARRGVKSQDELMLTLAKMHHIDQLRGITQGCDVLFDAFQSNEKIMIIGDFDADGATSTALMMESLTLLGSQNHAFLVPNRFEYGYGLSPEIVDDAARMGAKLLITVDNGISCIAGVERAKDLGLKVIITDHHLPGSKLPKANAIINPNQPNCSFPSKAIAGVGVAFYFMMAMRRYLRDKNWFTDKEIIEPNLAQLLDLVALGTVADVVSLDANNRILVAQGLKRIRAGQTRPGIQALIEIAGRNQQRLVASDFGFALGPRINAAGRLDDMSFGINCLLAQDLSQARAMAAELDDLNKARREIEQGMQQEAENVLASLNFSANSLPNAIALYRNDWHQGVIGIVAGRLKEKFHRPSIVFAKGEENASAVGNKNEIKGSARSIPGLHIRDLLEHISSQHPGIIKKFGGHAMAAGLSIEEDKFEEFNKLFNDYAGKWLSKEDFESELLSDGALSSELINMEFAELIRNSGPWGQQFPEPIFDDEFEVVQQRLVGEKHLKMVLQKGNEVFDAIAFNIDLKKWPNMQAKNVKVAYRLDINEFRGKQTVQLMVEDISI